MARAIQAFKQAITIDDDFALAHAALSRAYLLMVENGYEPADEYLPLAREEIDVAMSLDSMQAEVRSAKATFQFRTGRDWDGLREQYQAAVDLNPN